MPRNVALFITCLSDQFYPQVGIAITKILEHLGCRVCFPQKQTCCGQPFFNNGYHDQARRLAKRMIEVFEGYEYVVTPSGSCCAMVRENYPRLLGSDHAWEPGMRRLCRATFEFVEFLETVLKVDFSAYKLPERRVVTYHSSCHTRALAGRDRAAEALRSLGNVDLRPMEKAEQCCGFGGTFAVKYPAISRAMVQDKLRRVASTTAPTTVCNEAGCSLNISGACHRDGVPTQLTHFAELMAEAMGLDIQQW